MAKVSTYIDDKGRKCTGCGIYKEWTHYTRNNKVKSGHASRCKECVNGTPRALRNVKKECLRASELKQLRKKNNPIEWKATQIRNNLLRRKPQFNFITTENTASKAEIIDWLESIQPYKDYYTGEPLDLFESQVDHKIPLSRGGTNDISNLCLCSQKINAAKGKMTDEEFIALLECISQWEDNGDYVLARLRMGWRVR